MSTPYVTIHSTTWLDEARTLQMLLRGEGFHVFLDNEHSAGLVLGQDEIHVQVPGQEAEAAAEVLNSYFDAADEAQDAGPDACLRCRAAMPEMAEACASCGWTWRRED